MSSEIKIWQINNKKLVPISSTLIDEERKEKEDLEQWIKSEPNILGKDLILIGEQVSTKSGPLDLLGIDKSGNIVIIELKRDRLPRESLAQAIDYASDISTWDINKLSEKCIKFCGQDLETYVSDNFEDINLKEISINQNQRILLVGTYVEESLQRMIDWLSDKYQVSINALILKYIKTEKGDELLARTMIIPEEIEKERSQRQQRKIAMSDEPGNYSNEELIILLENYLSENRKTPNRIKNILIPLCLKNNIVKRDEIKTELINQGEAKDDTQAGIILTTISREIGIKKRDYLRQILRYERPNPWEKDNYKIPKKYKLLIKSLSHYQSSSLN